MTIQLNGKPHAIDTVMTVAELLATLGLEDKPVVVELNEQPVFPRDFSSASVGEGAKVEVVTLAAGG